MPQRLIRVTNPTTHETMVTSWSYQGDPTDDEINSMLAERRTQNLGKIEEAGRVDIPWYQRAAAKVPEPLVRGLQAFDWHPIEAAKEIGAGAREVITGIGEEEEPRTAGFRKIGRGAFGVVGPPAMAAGSVVAPIPTAAIIGTGVGASYLRPYAERGLEKVGALPELAGAGLDVAELATMLKIGGRPSRAAVPGVPAAPARGAFRVQEVIPRWAPDWIRGRWGRPEPPPPPKPPPPPVGALTPTSTTAPIVPAAAVPLPDLQSEIARVVDTVAAAAQRGDKAAIVALRPQVEALRQRMLAEQTPATQPAEPMIPPVPPPATQPVEQPGLPPVPPPAPLQDAAAFEAHQFTRNIEGRPPSADVLGAQQLGRNVREAIGDVPPPEEFRLDLEEAVPGAREAELMEQLERNVREAMRGARPVETPIPSVPEEAFLTGDIGELNRQLEHLRVTTRAHDEQIINQYFPEWYQEFQRARQNRRDVIIESLDFGDEPQKHPAYQALYGSRADYPGRLTHETLADALSTHNRLMPSDNTLEAVGERLGYAVTQDLNDIGVQRALLDLSQMYERLGGRGPDLPKLIYDKAIARGMEPTDAWFTVKSVMSKLRPVGAGEPARPELQAPRPQLPAPVESAKPTLAAAPPPAPLLREATRGARPVETGELELEVDPDIARFVKNFKDELNRRIAGAQPEAIPTTRPMLPKELADFGPRRSGRGTTTAETPRAPMDEAQLVPPQQTIGLTGEALVDIPNQLRTKAQELLGKGWDDLIDKERDFIIKELQREAAPVEQRVAPERVGAQSLIDEMRSRGIGFTDLLTELRNRMEGQAERAAAFEGGAAERLRAPMERQALPAVEPFVPPATEAPTELPRVPSPQEVRLQQQYNSALAKVKANPFDPQAPIDPVVSNGRALGKSFEEVGVDLREAGVPDGIMVNRVRRGYGVSEATPEPEQVLSEKTGFGAALRKLRRGGVPIKRRTPSEMRRDARPFEPAPPSTARTVEPSEVEAESTLRKLWHDEEGQLDFKELAKGLRQFRDNFVNVARLEVTSGREHLKKFGPAGIQADKEINNFIRLRHEYHGELERTWYWDLLTKVGADKDQGLWQQIVARLEPNVAEAKKWTIEPNPTADTVAANIRKVDDLLHERMRARGVHGVGSEELGYVEDHFPHMYPDEMWGDVVSAKAQQLYDDKRFPNVAAAQEFVNNVIRSQGERIAPNIQLPRTTENAALIRTDRAVLPEYYLQVADKLAEAEVLGPKGKGSALPARMLEHAAEVYRTTKSRAQMDQFLELVKKVLAPEPLSAAKAEVWQKTHSAMVLTKMGLSFLANSSQFLYPYVLTGIKPMLRSAALLAKEYRTSGRDFVGDAAVTSDNFLQWLRYREGVGRTAGGWLLQRATPFAAEERLGNRPISSHAGGFWLEELYNKLKADPKNAYVRRQLSKHLEIDPDELLSTGLTEEMKQHAKFSMTQKTQFGYNPLELPGGWGTTLTSRMRHEFMNFAFNAMKFTKDAVYGELKHGNPMPLIRMLVAGQVAGEVVADINAIIRNKERPDNIVLRMIDNQVTWGAFGIASSIFMSLGIAGGLASLAIGAAPSTVVGYIQSAWPTSRPGSLIRRGVSDIPLVGKTIAGYAFPRKQPTSRVPPPFPRRQSRPRGAPPPF